MFWRILRRLLRANPARLATVLLALGAGAAVSAALLNLKVDAERRLTTEFRAFGANVAIAPRDSSDSSVAPELLDQSVFDEVPAQNGSLEVTKAEFLSTIAEVSALRTGNAGAGSVQHTRAVVVGYAVAVGPGQVVHGLGRILPSRIIEGRNIDSLNIRTCEIGQKAAAELDVRVGALLGVKNGDSDQLLCAISDIRSFGGPEDGQIFLELPAVQLFLKLPGRISMIQASVPGAPQSIQDYITTLQGRLSSVEVRAIRQFSQAEGQLYDRIRGLLTATVAVILVLTALCVMAAMTNAAMERQHDVGLMKAIGGPVNRVMRIFLTEAAILGVVGGILGAAAGIGLSVWLGKAVFGVAARPRLIVYPVTVALTILVAIAGAFPLRRLGSVKPAVIFRGEA
jgi:putative ABC transport system permease protein